MWIIDWVVCIYTVLCCAQNLFACCQFQKPTKFKILKIFNNILSKQNTCSISNYKRKKYTPTRNVYLFILLHKICSPFYKHLFLSWLQIHYMFSFFSIFFLVFYFVFFLVLSRAREQRECCFLSRALLSADCEMRCECCTHLAPKSKIETNFPYFQKFEYWKTGSAGKNGACAPRHCTCKQWSAVCCFSLMSELMIGWRGNYTAPQPKKSSASNNNNSCNINYTCRQLNCIAAAAPKYAT